MIDKIDIINIPFRIGGSTSSAISIYGEKATSGRIAALYRPTVIDSISNKNQKHIDI